MSHCAANSVSMRIAMLHTPSSGVALIVVLFFARCQHPVHVWLGQKRIRLPLQVFFGHGRPM
jgi:hypothetical protein